MQCINRSRELRQALALDCRRDDVNTFCPDSAGDNDDQEPPMIPPRLPDTAAATNRFGNEQQQQRQQESMCDGSREAAAFGRRRLLHYDNPMRDSLLERLSSLSASDNPVATESADRFSRPYVGLDHT